MQKIDITDEDLKVARALCETQLLNPLTAESMFTAGIYSILSVAERYDKHTLVYNDMMNNGLNAPEEIINRPGDVKDIVRVARFPKQKIDRITRFARWWERDGGSFSRDVLDDVANGRNREFELRNRLAESAPGIAYKAASLFMSQCGYQNVVSIDVWMIRALYGMGYDVAVPDYMTTSGPLKKEYLRLEKILMGIAREEYGLSPVIFQSALWAKLSSWNRKIL